MAFNSLQFAIYLPTVCILYFILPVKYRNYWLLAASYYFYMSWNVKYVFLILFTTLTSYLAGRLLGRTTGEGRRKAILAAGIIASVASLFVFKYANFVIGNINLVMESLHATGRIPVLNVLLPVGISFYTFQTLSYVIDVYRGKLPAEKDFFVYALYVSFFPQLVAGPIERATNLLPQFREVHRFDTARCSDGLRRILVGLFKKIVIADYFAIYVNEVYSRMRELNGTAVMFATFLFAIQIYCDFSAYSDIAIGSALILGFRLMENFRSPYLSDSFSEFWKRWHISLSTWLQDYIFVPLVWSRWWDKLFNRHTIDGKKPAVLPNLIIVFLISGIWHGAGWTFIVWGLLHGIYRVIEETVIPKKWKKRKNKKKVVLWLEVGLVFVMNCFSLIFFRADTIGDALYAVSRIVRDFDPVHLMTYMQPAGLEEYRQLLWIILLVAVLFLWDLLNYSGEGFEKLSSFRPVLRYAVYYVLGLAVVWRIFTSMSDIVIEFIYFQF